MSTVKRRAGISPGSKMKRRRPSASTAPAGRSATPGSGAPLHPRSGRPRSARDSAYATSRPSGETVSSHSMPSEERSALSARPGAAPPLQSRRRRAARSRALACREHDPVPSGRKHAATSSANGSLRTRGTPAPVGRAAISPARKTRAHLPSAERSWGTPSPKRIAPRRPGLSIDSGVSALALRILPEKKTATVIGDVGADEFSSQARLLSCDAPASRPNIRRRVLKLPY